MNLTKLRVHLRDSQFPMLSSLIGDTVIDRGLDFHNSGLPSNQGSESQHNLGTPQVMYAENVLPIAEGFTSVCYTPLDLPCSERVGVDTCATLRVPRPRSPHTSFLDVDAITTVAQVHHRVFAYQSGAANLWELEDEDSCTGDAACKLKRVPIDCLNTDCLIGVTATDNRLVMYSTDTLFWGNIESGKETDFQPSFSNGANSVKPSDLLGAIVLCVPLGDGIAIYGTENALWMSFSGDIHNKYKFQRMLGVGGITSPKHVAFQGNSAGHYAWTSNGLQYVYPARESKLMFPSVSEFLQGNIIEDYEEVPCDDLGIETPSAESSQCIGGCDGASGLATCVTPPDAPTYINNRDDTHGDCGYSPTCPHIRESVVTCPDGLNKMLSNVGLNYLAISYGRDCGCVYDYILLWDSRLGRWGKLKIRHRAVFEAPNRSATSHNIGITLEDGTKVTVNTNHVSTIDCGKREVVPCKGVLVLGRYTLSRASYSELHTVDVQRVHPESAFALWTYPTWDGMNTVTDVMQPCTLTRNTGTRSYITRSSGHSHTIELVGTFQLTSLVLGFKPNGRTNY